MDKEYLEDYWQKELSEYRNVEQDIEEGKFSFYEDVYPPDNRFFLPQKPFVKNAVHGNIWAQIPFSGSLIARIAPLPQDAFEREYFKCSMIPKVIDFVKETGRLQFVLPESPTTYEGLTYLYPLFVELRPPIIPGAPISILGTDEEIKKEFTRFDALANINFFDYMRNYAYRFDSRVFEPWKNKCRYVYGTLRLRHYSVTEELENLMIDNPEEAWKLFTICQHFITDPLRELRPYVQNYSLEMAQLSQDLPLVYHPNEIRLPCEIGRFLISKLTNAPLGMRACYDIIDYYEYYDLQKVQRALNEGITTNNPKIIEKNVKDLDAILENVWNDPTVPNRIKNLKRGLHISIAAVGAGVPALTGGLGGLLAGLGFSVGSGFLKADIDAASEKFGKFFSRSYQANIYDFKKKYKGKLAN